MAKKNFVNRLLSNTRKPEGFLGRLMLRGMNTGHAGLAKWGMSCLKWQLHWTVLDIGCGGGANLAQILRYCPLGKAYGVDLSPESVAFAKKKNRKELEVNCFVEQGSADNLPHTDGMFDVVTAFETVYFWGDLDGAFTEVARVLKPGGYFLLCNEMCDPTDTTWTDRIEGMVIRPAEELVVLLLQTGFTDISQNSNKGHLCITARKYPKKH